MFFNKPKNTVKTEVNDSGLQPVDITPPKEEPSKAVYRIGFTENNRVIFTIGEFPYANSFTMNANGVRNLIQLLEATLNDDSLEDYETDEPIDNPE